MKLLPLAALAASTFAIPAYATVYDFSIVSATQAGDANYVPNYQFSLDTNDVGGNGFFSNDYSLTFFNVATTGQRPALGAPNGDVSYSANYNFFTMETLGGFDDSGAGHSYIGDQLFGGTTADPQFLIGKHNLFYDDTMGPADAVLTITEEAPAVPETASWVMMIIGIGAVGGMMRGIYWRYEQRLIAKTRGLSRTSTFTL